MALSLAFIRFTSSYYVNKTKLVTYSVIRNITNKCNSNSFVVFNNRNYIQNHIEKSKIQFVGITENTCFKSITSANIKCYSSVSGKNDDNDDTDKKRQHSKRSLPELMEFPEIVWPSILKSIKNWILVTYIIRPYFDREFNLPDFVTGTKHALQIVSAKLAEGDLTSLSGLVTSEAIEDLKNVIAKMSVVQRMELRVNKEDIYLSFPYQVGIIFDESNERIQKRWVEITMVFHVLRGLKDMQDRGQSPPLNMGILPEYRDKICICNYRFIKEFTQGHESDWTINVINHFKPSDFLTD